MRKRAFTLVAALLVIAMLLSACGGDTEGGGTEGGGSPTPPQNNTDPVTPTKDYTEDVGESGGGAVDTGTGQDRPAYWPAPDELEAATFSMFVAEVGQAPSSNNQVVKMVEDFTKVHIEFEFLVGDIEQRMGTMIAAENYPDLINPANVRNTYQVEGAFIPLQNELPKYDNLRKHYEPYYAKMISASPDDNIYLLDIWNRVYGEPIMTYYNGPAFWVQKDVLVENGYKIPETLDEFFDMLEAYKNKYPTIDDQPTLGFEILSTITPAFPLWNAPQHLIGGPNDGDVYVHQDTMEAEIYFNKDYAKRYYQTLNNAYKKGLINPETFTRNKDQYVSNIAAGRVLAMFDQQWQFENGEKVLQTDNKYERTYVPLGLVYEGYEPWYKEVKGFQGGNGIGISISCKDPDRALLFMDMMLDLEFQQLMAWGVEGTDYYKTDEGRVRRTPEQKSNWDNQDYLTQSTAKRLYDQFPKIQGYFPDGNCVSTGDQPEEIMENTAEYDKEFYSHFTTPGGNPFATPADFLTVRLDANGLPVDMPAYYPVWNFSIRKTSDAGQARDKIYELGKDNLPLVIMADDFEAEWSRYVGLIDNVDYKAFEDEVTRQIKEKMASPPSE